MMTADAQDLKGRTRRLARKAGWRGFRYAVVLASAHCPETGEPCWHLTTRGGEQLWLTNAMLGAVRGHHWWLQGKTTCSLEAWHADTDGELCEDIHLTLYHGPHPGREGEDLALITESRIALGMTRPIVLLSTRRPGAWPR